MSWNGIQGHDLVADHFRHAIASGRLASTFLFVGPPGIGKRTFALKFAQSLLCESVDEAELAPCGHCPSCQQVTALSHPDLEIVAKPKDRSFIPIDLFIGDRDHRMREGLCHNISLKPFYGGRKIAIIDDADYLNQEGANCLLKTLEEPPPRSIIILIGTSEQKQLPTIRSRSQIVRFRPLPEDVVADLLVSNAVVTDEDHARKLAALADGSPETALQLADPEMDEFRQLLLDELSQPDIHSVDLVKAVIQFVDAAGKDAPPRRARMMLIFDFAIKFYSQLMRSLSGAPVVGDDVLVRAVKAAHADFAGDAESAGECLERCVEAHAHVRANANQATLLECWLDDLASLSRNQPIAG